MIIPDPIPTYSGIPDPNLTFQINSDPDTTPNIASKLSYRKGN